jgi:hypothetical protein
MTSFTISSGWVRSSASSSNVVLSIKIIRGGDYLQFKFFQRTIPNGSWDLKKQNESAIITRKYAQKAKPPKLAGRRINVAQNLRLGVKK